MKKYQEVEVKYKLYNGFMVKEKLHNLKATHVLDDEKQKDIYYTPYHRDFLENEIVSEWLRVRETGKGASLNFKQFLPIGAKIQNQCNEYETQISDAFALKCILNELNFREIAVVSKVRNSWVYGDVEISIDHVEELGDFIELEATMPVPEEEMPVWQNKFSEIIAVLEAKVGERDRRGYPYQIIEKGRKDRNAF